MTSSNARGSAVTLSTPNCSGSAPEGTLLGSARTREGSSLFGLEGDECGAEFSGRALATDGTGSSLTTAGTDPGAGGVAAGRLRSGLDLSARGTKANAAAMTPSEAAPRSQPGPRFDAPLSLLEEMPEGSRTLSSTFEGSGSNWCWRVAGIAGVAGKSTRGWGALESRRVQTSTSSRAAKVRVAGAL